LIFESKTLSDVRTIYDNYTYVLELTAQFIPDKLPEERISDFISMKRSKEA